ncbi:MAG TPA: hypothetical protein VGC08_14115 [Pedobacter sp.]
MSTIKFHNEDPLKIGLKDLMPVVLSVLNLIEADFLRWSMKIAVKVNYKDLKGLIDFENIEQTEIDMLNMTEDPCIKLMMIHASKFQASAHTYANLFALNLDEIFADERIVDMAGDLYWTLIYDNEEDNEEGYDRDLRMFINSVLQILHSLCELVINGTADLETSAFEDDGCYKLPDADWEKYMDAEAHEPRLLVNLMKDVELCYHALAEL